MGRRTICSNLVRRAYPYRDLPRRRFRRCHRDAFRRDCHEAGPQRRISSSRSDQRHGPRTARRAACRDYVGRRDSGERQLLRCGRTGRNHRRDADEDFAVESLAGDVFLLGTTSGGSGASKRAAFAWKTRMARRLDSLLARRSARDARSNCRRSRAHPGRDHTRERAGRMAHARVRLDRRGAEQAALYVRAGAAALGALPNQQTVVAERFFDEGGGMQLVIHAPSARGSIAHGDFRFENGSAGRSISSFKPPPPTMALSFRSVNSTAFRSSPFSNF